MKMKVLIILIISLFTLSPQAFGMQKIGLSSEDIQFYYEKIVSVVKEWQKKVVERYHPKNTFAAIEQKEVKK